MYAKILFMTAFILSGQAFADGMPSSEESLKYLKDHFSATYHGEYYFVRRDVYSANDADHDISDVKFMHNPTVLYKPTPDWQVMATAEFKYTDQPGAADGTYVNNYYRSLFTVTRKNLLTEKENGFKLDAGFGRRDFNGSAQPQTFGNYRVFSTVSKTFGAHSASLFSQYLYNDPKKSKASTWRHGLELIPTLTFQLADKLTYMFTDDININTSYGNKPAVTRELTITHEASLAYITYTFNDKFAPYYQVKYYHSSSFDDISPKGEDTKNDDYFEHYIGLAYTHNAHASVTLEIGSEIFHARDGKNFFSKKARYPEAAIYLDLSI